MNGVVESFLGEAVRWGPLVITRAVLAEEMTQAGYSRKDVDFWAFAPSRRVDGAPLDPVTTRKIFRAYEAGDPAKAFEIAEAAA